MVDVVRYCVVIKNRRVFLLEVWSDCLDQHRTCENRNQKTIYYQISAPDHWNEKWQLLLTSPHFPILCRAGFNQKIFRKRTQYLCFSVRLTFQKLFQKQMKRKRLTGKKNKPSTCLSFSVMWKQSKRWQGRAAGTRSCIFFVLGCKSVYRNVSLMHKTSENNLTTQLAWSGKVITVMFLFFFFTLIKSKVCF